MSQDDLECPTSSTYIMYAPIWVMCLYDWLHPTVSADTAASDVLFCLGSDNVYSLLEPKGLIRYRYCSALVPSMYAVYVNPLEVKKDL